MSPEKARGDKLAKKIICRKRTLFCGIATLSRGDSTQLASIPGAMAARLILLRRCKRAMGRNDPIPQHSVLGLSEKW